MLDNEGQRELAYLVTVDEIREIPNYDRICQYRVGGWWLVSGKGDYQVGDTALYIEIDSLCPYTQEFAFLDEQFNDAGEKIRPDRHKIKTQRFARGTALSQGLLCPLKDFPQLQGKEVGYFCTNELGITYYEKEDNVRKASNEQLTNMKVEKRLERWSKKHKFLSKFKFIREWKRKAILNRIKKQQQKKKSDWNLRMPEISKTDEERCLEAGVKVSTDQGRLRIGDIVNKRLPVKVKSYNLESKKIEYKEILDYQKFASDSEWYIIKVPFSIGSSLRKNTIKCTGDHKFLTTRGYVKAKDLTLDDIIYRETYTYADDSVLEYLYGNILGDGHLYKENNLVRFSFDQGENYADYVKILHNLYNAGSYIVEKNGFNENKLNHKFGLQNTGLLKASINDDGIFTTANKWELNEKFLNKLTWRSLALWYLDDGSFYENPQTNNISISLHTESYSVEENMLLIKILKDKFGLEAKLKDYKYHYLTLDNKNSQFFIDNVKDYVPECLKNKMPTKYKDLPCLLDSIKFEFCDRLLPTKILSIDIIKNKRKSSYDIEVADNHNFFANGILTHNCQNCFNQMKALNLKWMLTEKIDGTSSTFFKRRGKKELFTVASRNVIYDAPEKEDRNFYKDTDGNVYIKMAEKYRIEELFDNILRDNPNFEYICFQGETYGGTIQKRNYGPEHRLAIFNVIYQEKGKNQVRLNPLDMLKQIEVWNKLYNTQIECVPLIDPEYELPETCDELLEYAESELSRIDHGMREGVVLRSIEGRTSFKAVSNQFLSKYHS